MRMQIKIKNVNISLEEWSIIMDKLNMAIITRKFIAKH